MWRRGDRPTLVQMQEDGVNMVDVRRELGVRSIRWKVEKRCLERIGHVLRMKDDRMVKAVVLGWMSKLEEWPKCKGRSRKTILYWRKLVKEAGWDYTKIAGFATDRGEWKRRVKERMEHLEEYEWSTGKRWMGPVMERNREVVEDEVLKCEVCGKICKSKAGLTIHRKRMHEESEAKKQFQCECGKTFKQEANLKNHRRKCRGEEVVPRVYKGERGECPGCGKMMAKTNIARHRREACLGGEAGLDEA